MVNLPYERERFCVWLDRRSAANLRELLMPVCPGNPTCRVLSFKIYEALLRMTMAEMEAINVPLFEDEILLINSLVKNKHWETSEAMLLQTWQVAYERKHGQAFRVSAKMRAIVEEDKNAIHPSTAEETSQDSGDGPSHAGRWRP